MSEQTPEDQPNEPTDETPVADQPTDEPATDAQALDQRPDESDIWMNNRQFDDEPD